MSFHSAMSQDIIVLNNENVDELEVKIIEVTDEFVRYKKWTYQDGPVFSVSTDAIFMIKYQNGEKQRFAGTTPSEPTYQPRKETLRPANRPSQSYTPSAVERRPRRFQNFTPHISGSMTMGYMLGLGEYSLDAINFLDLNIGWQFNPYFWVGGSIGHTFFYDIPEELPGFVGIMASTRGSIPVSDKFSFFGEFGIGVGIGYGICETNYLLRVGPGIKIGNFTVAPLYTKFGEGDGAMLFQVGYSHAF